MLRYVVPVLERDDEIKNSGRNLFSIGLLLANRRLLFYVRMLFLSVRPSDAVLAFCIGNEKRGLKDGFLIDRTRVLTILLIFLSTAVTQKENENLTNSQANLEHFLTERLFVSVQPLGYFP